MTSECSQCDRIWCDIDNRSWDVLSPTLYHEIITRCKWLDTNELNIFYLPGMFPKSLNTRKSVSDGMIPA